MKEKKVNHCYKIKNRHIKACFFIAPKKGEYLFYSEVLPLTECLCLTKGGSKYFKEFYNKSIDI